MKTNEISVGFLCWEHHTERGGRGGEGGRRGGGGMGEGFVSEYNLCLEGRGEKGARKARLRGKSIVDWEGTTRDSFTIVPAFTCLVCSNGCSPSF